jgi:hypothetical protein
MRAWVLVCVFMVCWQPGVAQKITVSGIAIDKETREPLVFATIGIKGKSIGTITNLEGGFDFHIPLEYKNEILVISMLGYKNFESPIWSLLIDETAPVNIEMTKSTTVLDEVVVNELYTGGDILQIALDRVEQNYPMRPFLMEGFYRDIKKVGGTNIALLEAAVKIYDTDYAEPRNKLKLRERVKLLEVRKSLGYDSRFTYYFDQVNFLEDLLLHNDIRYRQFDTREEVLKRLRRLDDSYYNNEEIYVLEYNQDFFLRLFINKTNFAIVHLEYEIGPTVRIVEKKKNLISRFSGLKKSIDFRMVNGRLYPSFMNMSTRVSWYDAETNDFKFETEVLQQILINDILPDTPERIGVNEKMRHYSLQYQDQPYNKEFWDNYNVIKDTPLDKKILEDIEKSGPLQKQFEGKINNQ